jgi:dihydropyrimidinase
MSNKIIIKNGRIITAVDNYKADIIIENEKIDCIGNKLNPSSDYMVIDAEDLYVFPGGVDCHTHLENTFGDSTTADDFISGTKAGAFGGTTTIIDFAFQGEGIGVMHSIDEAMKRADGKSSIDYGFHMVARHINDQVLVDMKSAILNEGVTSFKLYMAYPGKMMVDDSDILQVLKLAGQTGGIVCLHAENGIVIEQLIREALNQGHTSPRYHTLTRPSILEGEATHRGICLAELAEAPVYFVHLSALEALKQVVEARDRGIPAFAETCPHYLFFDESVYENDNFETAKYVMSPPLRSKEAQNNLWRALKYDDLQVIATDHCPYCMKEGDLGKINQKPYGKNDFSKIPNGAPGLQDRMTVVFDGGVKTGKLSLNRFIQLMSTNPAKIFGMFPRKGTIAIGSDADIVIFDPNEQHVLSSNTNYSNCDYTLFEGRQVTGRVKKVILRGKIIVDGDNWLGSPGYGNFQKRKEFCGF